MVTKLNVTDCRRHAAECELEATRASDPISREFFRSVADEWYRIADTFTYFEQRRRTLARPDPAGWFTTPRRCPVSAGR
jgi:hypothetical protein